MNSVWIENQVSKVDHYCCEMFSRHLASEGKRQVRAYARLGIAAAFLIEKDQKQRRTGQYKSKPDLVKNDRGYSNFLNFLQRQIRDPRLDGALRKSDRVKLDANGDVIFVRDAM